MKKTKEQLIKEINNAPIPAKRKKSLIKMVLRSTSK
jgi:hypothetical protein|tara:strand:+ start:1009 stop:1116 length:108 start_codon:yes stop_codon:yes gene_type:complete